MMTVAQGDVIMKKLDSMEKRLDEMHSLLLYISAGNHALMLFDRDKDEKI